MPANLVIIRMGEQTTTELAPAIRDWAAHQDFSKRGSRRCRNRVTTLLAYKPDLSGPQGDVATAMGEMYRRARHNHKSPDRGMSVRRRGLLEDLLALGLEPDRPDAMGDTLLHHLCRHDAPMADIRLLFGCGAVAAVNAPNAGGETPLLAHLLSSSPTQGIVNMLLHHGADPGVADHDGVTPMQALQVKSPRLPTAEKLSEILESHQTKPQTPAASIRPD